MKLDVNLAVENGSFHHLAPDLRERVVQHFKSLDSVPETPTRLEIFRKARQQSEPRYKDSVLSHNWTIEIAQSAVAMGQDIESVCRTIIKFEDTLNRMRRSGDYLFSHHVISPTTRAFYYSYIISITSLDSLLFMMRELHPIVEKNEGWNVNMTLRFAEAFSEYPGQPIEWLFEVAQ